MHEASLHEDNCFVTLTYDDEHLPPDGSLDRAAFPLFMKKLRKVTKVRYLHCGEYGDTTLRPHYHACLFGFGFPDKVQTGERGGYPVSRSPLLERLWPEGHSEIGSLTFESASYVARYVCKKLSKLRYARGDRESFLNAQEALYSRVDPLTGELVQVEPEYATMSRNPGIGAKWFDKYGSDVFPSDEVVSNGHPAPPPRYYLERLRASDPGAAEQISVRRRERRNLEESRRERLRVREVCLQKKLNLYRERSL